MIPLLDTPSTSQNSYLQFIERLKKDGFLGDLNVDYSSKLVLSTDNSIYQVLPQGVIYPKNQKDLELIAEIASYPEFRDITLSARGGGTGTNGQSLTNGLIIDTSKHMNKILEINEEERWVKVQTGVVKDQLNKAVEKYGLFFAPELSTSNRATIGGMINTDASGQGSVLYGKTRDHVLELTSVWLGGKSWISKAIDDTELAQILDRGDIIGEVHRKLNNLEQNHKDEIIARFPKLNRCLTGYDLAHIRDESGLFNLNSVLCGAEGSLAFISEAKLRLLPIPKYSALVNIKYDSFENSMRDAKALMEWGPTSIETIDSKVLNLAMEDIVWESVSSYFPTSSLEPTIQGINLVEYTSDNLDSLEEKIHRLTKHLEQVSGTPGQSFGFTVARGSKEINKIWGMRKKAVGLLGNTNSSKRPIPFVEDTAVPPENLADFIMEFRSVLDARNLSYGMFGHVDAGVLHVRPAIDMKDPSQEKLIREITDEVVALTKKYKGLLWGEHGKGVRSEYAPEFFGPIYPLVQEVKAAFDPFNQMNPGKIATPAVEGAELLKIDEVPTRGQFDRQIPHNVREEYSSAMNCNGNGGCYNFDPNDLMCPSWKGTRDRIHSPKGRSTLIREWLRLLSNKGVNVSDLQISEPAGTGITGAFKRALNTIRRNQGQYDFSNEVYDAMKGCLACKSCVGQCPVKVNVPDFRSRFLSLYHTRYLRPTKDYAIAGLEYIIPYAARFPSLYNLTMSNFLTRSVLTHGIGIVDTPMLSNLNLGKELNRREVKYASTVLLKQLTDDERKKTLVVVQDAFTSFFETQLFLDIVDFLRKLGVNVMVAPFKANGKPLHVHGFLKNFSSVAKRNINFLNNIENHGVSLVGIDPSMTLTFRQEYSKITSGPLPKVYLLQEWLKENEVFLSNITLKTSKTFKLLIHCTEKSNAPSSVRIWEEVFEALGQKLDIINSGCCGMSGTYGHESANLDNSKAIYKQSWGDIISNTETTDSIIATGYSCRSQVKRFDQLSIKHPIQALLYLSKS